MNRSISALVFVLASVVSSVSFAAPPTRPTAIVGAREAAVAEALAVKEVRRYLYVRTGQLLPIVTRVDKTSDGDLIVVGGKTQPVIRELLADAPIEKAVRDLGPGQYVLKSFQQGDRSIVLVAGGDSQGTLYGAYRLAEHMGVRFYLHGDVVPDRQIAPEIPEVDEVGRPLFNRRGIQPFHDFPEGPDWWSVDAYKAILGQLPKLRMNFFGLHTYPEGGVGPEPLVWIGQPQDVNDDGTVKFSYPSRHFVTSNVTGSWGYRSMKTSDYTFGAAAMFDRDDYGADYMRGTHPWNRMSPEEQNALFDRMGRVVNEAFTFAGQLGIKTCIGTETPLTIPTPVKERLRAAGKDPADPAVVEEVYRGLFQRIMKTHPLDYYWFWTPEGWTWSGTKQEQIDATLADLRAAMAAAKKADAPFTLATCGWVLGPQQDRALFDNFLPKEMPMSCINRQVGHAPVEPGFADVKGRPQWAIPWMEDDPALNSPQLWVGRMRKDAADALAYGCTGLMGIHWRTRILGPNVSALAHAAWDQSAWNPALGSQPQPPAPKAPAGPVGGKYASFPNNPIADTEDDPIYQTVRYDVAAYHLDVPNGKYSVTVKLCEPHYKERNRRVFGVKVQGRQLIDRIDLFAKVGQNRADDHTMKDVEVSDGRLTIEFVHIVEFPCVAGIVVDGPAATRKINCGGPAWQDYQADWPASDSTPSNRFLASEDFYADWARSQFGSEAAKPIAELFAGLDGKLPRPTDWVHGPGGIKPDARPWEQVAKEYAFVDELAALRPLVKGPGNLERFDYWLNTFRYMRANAQVNCTWARVNQAMEQVKAAKDGDAKKRLARELVLPIRKELVEQVGEVHKYLLSAVTTPGGMGNVTNWQQHILPGLLTEPGKQLAEILGEDLPPDAVAGTEYEGPPRMFVPVVRTALAAGEPLAIEAILLGAEPGEAVVHWRSLGSESFNSVALEHIARGVYRTIVPGKSIKDDLEYYVETKTDGGTLRFPPTAPILNQTVVVLRAN